MQAETITAIANVVIAIGVVSGAIIAWLQLGRIKREIKNAANPMEVEIEWGLECKRHPLVDYDLYKTSTGDNFVACEHLARTESETGKIENKCKKEYKGEIVGCPWDSSTWGKNVTLKS